MKDYNIDYTGRVAIITGANGMDARTLTHFLLSKNYTVILTHRRNSLLDLESHKSLFTKELENYPLSKLDYAVCEISDQNSVNSCLQKVLKTYGKIDELYLLAAMSHVGYSFHQKESSIITNGQSVYYFLEFLKNNFKDTHVYFSATSELAGNVPNGELFTEKTSFYPKSPYSIGKELGCRWTDFYKESDDSNLFACYGILFNHSNEYRTKDFFIMKVCNAAARIVLGKEMELKLGNLEFYRDEHFSDFGVQAMHRMLQNDKPENYVIATGQTHHGEEYLDLAFNYFNLNWRDYVKLDKTLLRPNEVVRLIGDSSKAQKELGWNPNILSFVKHINIMCEFCYTKEKTGTAQKTFLYL